MSYADPVAVAPVATAAFSLPPPQEIALSVRLMSQAFALLANGTSHCGALPGDIEGARRRRSLPSQALADVAGFVAGKAFTYATGRGREDRLGFRVLLYFTSVLQAFQIAFLFAAMHFTFIGAC